MLAAVHRRAARPCAALFLIVIVVAGAEPPAAAQASPTVVYRPPVDARVHEPFRAPATPYGPGHRGIEYDTPPNTPVVVVAPGTVVFAGDVAGVLWITVRHPDGVRTTYGPLAGLAVTAEQLVAGGDVIGTTAGRLLLTARVGDNYVDPALLLSADDDDVHLVPEPSSLPSFSPSSFDVSDLFSPDAVVTALSWGRDGATEKVAAIYGITPVPFVLHTMDALAEWRLRQDHCTASGAPVPARSNRRLAVLVGGLGSTSETASIDDVDTTALGYETRDVVRFSYRGGRVPAKQPVGPELARLEITTYTASDSAGDLDTAGARLAALLAAVVGAAPGATVDVYAHSQGGLVVRIALAELAKRDPISLRRIGVVVTLATPHHGAQLAALAEALTYPPFGVQAVDAAGALAGTALRVDDPAIREVAPGSDLLRRLAAEPPPPGPTFLSLAAQGDPIVPSPDTRLEGAENVTVPVTGLGAHAALPGSSAATREMALALAGLPPSCESPADVVLDAVWGDLYHNGEQFLTATRGP